MNPEEEFDVARAIKSACYRAHADQCESAEFQDIEQMVWETYLRKQWDQYPVGKQIHLIRDEAKEAMRQEADSYRQFNGGYQNTPDTVATVLKSARWVTLGGWPVLDESARFNKAFEGCTRTQKLALFKRYCKEGELTDAEEYAASTGRDRMAYLLDLPSFGEPEDDREFEVTTRYKEVAA